MDSMTSTNRMSLGTSIALAALVIALFGWLRADIGDLRREVRADIGALRTGVQADMDGLRQSIARLDGRIVSLEDRMTGVESRMASVESRMARVEGLVEGLRPALAASGPAL